MGLFLRSEKSKFNPLLTLLYIRYVSGHTSGHTMGGSASHYACVGCLVSPTHSRLFLSYVVWACRGSVCSSGVTYVITTTSTPFLKLTYYVMFNTLL